MNLNKIIRLILTNLYFLLIEKGSTLMGRLTLGTKVVVKHKNRNNMIRFIDIILMRYLQYEIITQIKCLSSITYTQNFTTGAVNNRLTLSGLTGIKIIKKKN